MCCNCVYVAICDIELDVDVCQHETIVQFLCWTVVN